MATGGVHGIMEASCQPGPDVAASLLSRFGESSCKLIIVLDSTCQDGRVGLRRQFQVLVRKGMGSNPILDICFSVPCSFLNDDYFFLCFAVLFLFHVLCFALF